MAAGPRDTPPGRDRAADSDMSHETHASHGMRDSRPRVDPVGSHDPFGRLEPVESLDHPEGLDHLEPLPIPDGLEPLEGIEHLPSLEDGQSFGELRPPRRLHIWQIAPITALAVGGSLMFAFPLAFESGDAGPVVAMLGLLLCCCAAGWGLMAARRIGQTWPGLPARGSGARPDWRYVAGYTAVTVLLAVLAVWRVARLR